MIFNAAKLRVKELAEVLSVDSPEIIATCTLLKIPASSPLSSLSVEQSKEIIDYIQKTNANKNIDDK
ncbi:translation initiation factor IF-2 N-terminal domain-containing protein [Prochlorococcus marinus]|uniref:translation initiation factor IF-2 N-terminal domain-containing protein n=1 Tax=Prochlorococcus marinus TaxID=1219 RepID=UPI0022B4C207|nr:translation initiation factor IF-2 N-terminal domain-containing protein [Prochlorococcus marinus]